ncbi:MAG: ferritin family protein [Candidatus Omnitrophica bacterium]|nr:ferritin family protein [Candidatus Omnitrophota bacterium]
MGKFFEPSEILEFAIRIEENGERFYRQISKRFKPKEVKETFNYLADEEVKHKKIFENMLSKIEDYQPPQSYPEEYFLYLRAYADEHIFTKEKQAQVMAKKIKNIKEAIDFALQIELDSILYYLEAKNLVSTDQVSILNKVIDEEHRHYLKLSEMKKNL